MTTTMTGSRSVRSNVTLTLGMVTIPVNVHTAIREDKESSLNMLCTGAPGAEHGHDPVQVRESLKCPTCDNDDKESFGRGKPFGDGWKIVTEEEQAAIAGLGSPEELARATKTMEIIAYSRAEVEAALLPAGSLYFLDPSGPQSHYALIMHMLRSHPEKAFLTDWVPKTRKSTYELVVVRGALALRKLAFPEDCKVGPQITGTPEEAWVAMTDSFVAAISKEFDVEHFADNRRKQLAEILAGAPQLASGAVVEGKPAASSSDDLMAKLAASIEAATPKKAPAKRAPRKAPAKKTAARRKPAA